MKNLFSLFVFFLPISFCVHAFLGIDSYLSWGGGFIYNSWRMAELTIISICILLYTFLYPKTNIKISTRAFNIILIFFGLMLLGILQAKIQKLALLDFCFLIILLSQLYVWVQVQKNVLPHHIGFSVAILALSPCWIVLWLLIGYYLLFFHNLALDWHGLFINIRFYDDAALPCLFLVWYQPGFLKKYPKIVLIVSSLYILTLLIDGARATCLGIVVGLLVIAARYSKGYQYIITPIKSILLGMVWYGFTLLLTPDQFNNTILAKKTTSGRYELWIGSFESWLSQPLLGIGGANFITLDPSVNLDLGHPHNLFIQLLLEWGVAGLVMICWIIYCYYRLLSSSSYIPPLLLGGSIALLINALLSGAHIYPISQTVMLIFFSLVIHYYSKQKSNFSLESRTDESYRRLGNRRFVELPITYIGLLAILIILFIIRSSFFQYNTVTHTANASIGPRFWLDSKLVNLAPNNP